MAEGASEEQIADAERALGLRLPAALRTFLQKADGLAATGDEGSIVISGTDDLAAMNRHDVAPLEQHPGLLIFGSDGSRELLGLDVRWSDPPVVLIDITSGGWENGLLQAPTFQEFLEHLEDGGGLTWDVPYAPPS